jgi:hypothetical protein
LAVKQLDFSQTKKTADPLLDSEMNFRSSYAKLEAERILSAATVRKHMETMLCLIDHIQG